MKTLPLAATLAALLGAAAPAPLLAQSGGQATPLTFEQVQRKYPQMSYVHIDKCDKNHDGMFTQAEMACVESIYQVMYRDPN